ncbi:MAG: hypothetical protein NVSMB16_15750 [Acidimicrobiales bacterium]
MGPDQRDLVAGVFDRAADTYDNVGVDFFRPIADHLVTALAPQPGERALDVGCGRGAALFSLARAVGRTGRVTGVDLAPRMVEATAAEARAAGLKIDIVVGDAQDPPLDHDSLDVIASSLVLFFLPDPGAALRAWRSRLVPGGRLGISTFGGSSPGWQAVDAIFARYLPTQSTRPPDGPFSSDDGVERLFADAGLTDVRTHSVVIPVRFDDTDHWHRWSWSTGQRRIWEVVPEGERDAVRAAAYERLESCRGADGEIGFDQLVRFTLGWR